MKRRNFSTKLFRFINYNYSHNCKYTKLNKYIIRKDVKKSEFLDSLWLLDEKLSFSASIVTIIHLGSLVWK